MSVESVDIKLKAAYTKAQLIFNCLQKRVLDEMDHSVKKFCGHRGGGLGGVKKAGKKSWTSCLEAPLV